MDDSCNNNLNSTLNSESKNSGKWPCSGDTNLVEPEILEDMGVSMLDEEVLCESTRKYQSQEGADSPPTSDNRQCKKLHSFEGQDSVFRSSSFETISIDRFVPLSVVLFVFCDVLQCTFKEF